MNPADTNKSLVSIHERILDWFNYSDVEYPDLFDNKMWELTATCSCFGENASQNVRTKLKKKLKW